MSEKSYDGRQAFEELLSPMGGQSSALDAVLSARQCADAQLMKIACGLSPENPFSIYERLGGTYSAQGVKIAESPAPSHRAGGLKSDVKLFAHQQEAVDKIIAKDGNLLLSHPVGSGKTLTSIAAFEELRKLGKAERALVVAPASLRTNFVVNGVNRFTTSKAAIFGNAQEAAHGTHVTADKPDPKAQYHVVSYELFRADPKKYIDAAKADTVIYDELHRAKNEGVLTSKAIKDARQYHRNFIGMTGSIVSNTPADIVPLVDAMTNGNHLLGNKTTFEARFVTMNDKGEKSLRQPQVLRALVGPYIHHVDPSALQVSAPKKLIETIQVEMSPHQRDLYKFIKKDLDPLTELRLKAGISNLNNAQLNDMFAKLIKLRQVSNSIHTMDTRMSPEESAAKTPKVTRMLNDVQEHIKETPDAQVVIHTNLVHGGVDVLTAGLKARGVDYALFIGKGNAGVTEKSRQQGVKEFQEGKKKVIVLSAAGGEGLDLPNATMMAMMDGHYNPERINQAEARGVRAGGLAHRAADKRQVLVRRYVTVLPGSGLTRASEVGGNIWKNLNPAAIMGRLDAGGPMMFNPFKKERSTDEWVYSIAKGKAGLNNSLHESIKHSSAVPDHSTHEEYEEWMTEGLEKNAGGVLNFVERYPETIGAVAGGLYGLAMGGTPPRNAQEAKQDPNAPLRNRISSTVGGALGGAIAAHTILRPLMAGSRVEEASLMPLMQSAGMQVSMGSLAGTQLAGLWAPKTKVPQSAQDLLGKRLNYSDKALFETYWNRFGGELEEKGVTGKVSDEELEHKFVGALKDMYNSAKSSNRGKPETTVETEASRKKFLRIAGVATPLIGALSAIPSAAMQYHAHGKVSPVTTLLAAAPATMGIGGAFLRAYRNKFIDPGVTVTNKADARKRAKFTDEQLLDLLRGKVVEEVKTKAHVIK